jgi:peptidyl-prolyl cis-trans isomerase D
MLEALRNAAKGWVAKLLLALLMLSFVVWGIADVFTGGFRAQELATVGDVKISSEAFRRDLNTEIQRISQQTGATFSVEDARRVGLDQQILDRIIGTAVLEAHAEELGLLVSDKAIVDEIAANPMFQSGDGTFDPARFRQILQTNGLDEATFLFDQKRDKLRRAITDLAADVGTTPLALTEALMRYRNETRDTRYFTFQVNESDVAPPTDVDLKKQFDTTPAAYTAPEYRSIAVMKVEPSDLADRLAVSTDELKAGYDKFKADYFTAEKRTILQLSFPDLGKAEDARKRIDGGEDFLKVAAEFGAKETDVTFADRSKSDFLDAKIAEAAFTLTEGQVSAPVQGDLTIALLKAAKVTPEHQRSLEEVAAELTKRLQLDKAHEEIQAVYDAVEDARAQQTKFEEIAAKAGIPFTLVPSVSAAGLAKDGSDVQLPAKAELLKAAFESDAGVENDALTPFDGYLWFEVREVVPSALRPLETVKEQVAKDYVAGKLRTLAGDRAKALVEKAGSTGKLDSLALESGGAIKSLAGVKRTDISEAFDGLAALALFASPEGALTWSLEGDGKSAKIIEVTKVRAPVLQTASAEAKSLADEAKNGIAGDTFEVMLRAVRASTDVTINETLWQSIRGGTTQQ